MDEVARSSVMLSEIDRVQNPSFGALLLWTFGRSYQETFTEASANFLTYFLVLPICLHKPTLDVANSTMASSGIGKFCEKLGHEREELFAVHSRCLKLRELSLNSIAFGVRAGLLSVAYGAGTLRAYDRSQPKLAERIRPHVKGANKLGAWFRELDEVQVFRALKVEA
jgi:hypothetical protein